jgi:2-isopropylmalate synthase
VSDAGAEVTVRGEGSGPIDAFLAGISAYLGMPVVVVDYSEHAMGSGSDAEAVSYLRLQREGGKRTFGVGRDRDIVKASLVAVLRALGK